MSVRLNINWLGLNNYEITCTISKVNFQTCQTETTSVNQCPKD